MPMQSLIPDFIAYKIGKAASDRANFSLTEFQGRPCGNVVTLTRQKEEGYSNRGSRESSSECESRFLDNTVCTDAA